MRKICVMISFLIGCLGLTACDREIWVKYYHSPSKLFFDKGDFYAYEIEPITDGDIFFTISAKHIDDIYNIYIFLYTNTPDKSIYIKSVKLSSRQLSVTNTINKDFYFASEYRSYHEAEIDAFSRIPEQKFQRSTKFFTVVVTYVLDGEEKSKSFKVERHEVAAPIH